MSFLRGPRVRNRVRSGLLVILGPWLNFSVNWFTSPRWVCAATTAAVTFPADKQQPDTTYKVFLSVVSFTGTPGIGAFVPVSTTLLATTGFTLTVQAAPGLGNSVTFNVLIMRTI